MKKTQKELNSLDLAIINLGYSNLKNALSYFTIMANALPYLEIDWNNLTRAQKDSLSEDLKLTSNGIRILQQAERYYKGLIEALEKLEVLLDDKASITHFDLGTIGALELQAVELVYTMLTEGRPENVKKIHMYLHKFKWPDELKSAYDSLMNQRNELAIQYNKNHKDEIEDGKLQSA